MSSVPVLPGPTDAFPYRVDREAGSGAMGVVYRAIDIALERPVAIKVLRPEQAGSSDDEPRRRFLQEARAAAALTHPGVATIHQIGEVEGAPYIVMEWLPGTTLEELSMLDGAIPLERAAKLMDELLEVLETAHQAGIVHRDIKPSNLIVLPGGRLKVTDFGIARLQGRELVKTMAGSVLATPRYGSPEQLEGREVDGRSDLFSAAVVFYQLLTTKTPWPGETMTELITALLTMEPTPIRELQPTLPAPLGVWFDRALSRNRDERFANARDMLLALRRVMEPLSATRTPGASRSTKVMTPPACLFVSESALDGWSSILELINSWEGRELGTLDRETFLEKLLDRPLHAEPFAGAAFYGNRCLLVERGVIFATVGPDGRPDLEGELPARGAVRLHAMATGIRAGTMSLIATALQPGKARSEALDSTVVNISAFAAKLLESGFEGFMRLVAEGQSALVFLAGGTAPLALFAGVGSVDPRQVGWEGWLGTLEATVSFFDRRTRPPLSWYRSGFQDIEMRVTSDRSGGRGGRSADKTLSSTLSEEAPRRRRLLHAQLLEPERSQVGPATLSKSPLAKFMGWILQELPAVLVERKKTSGWKYLGDWLLLVRKARLYSKLERPNTQISDSFDLITEDGEGKVLHLARRLPRVDAKALDSFVEEVKAAKEARREGGDIGGVFLISPSFEEGVREGYRNLLNKGLGNKLFGLDKSMGYEGFVRLGARRGFHLLLVEENADGFEPWLTV